MQTRIDYVNFWKVAKTLPLLDNVFLVTDDDNVLQLVELIIAGT